MAKAGSGTKAVYVTGDAGLNALLSRLEQKVVKGLFRKAARTVAKALLPKIREVTPVLTGGLKKSLKVRALKRSRRARVGVQIQTGEGFFKGDQFYGGFIELGTKRIAPRRFIRDTADAFKSEANQLFESEIRAALTEDLPS